MTERNLIEWANYAIEDMYSCSLEVYGKPNLIINIISQIKLTYGMDKALFFAESIIKLTED